MLPMPQPNCWIRAWIWSQNIYTPQGAWIDESEYFYKETGGCQIEVWKTLGQSIASSVTGLTVPKKPSWVLVHNAGTKTAYVFYDGFGWSAIPNDPRGWVPIYPPITPQAYGEM